MSNLDHLNDPQQQAVKTTEGPLLVLAGAGSGKTTVIVNRIAYIINSYLANPNQILAVTFTNKAAGEMKQRVANQIGQLADFLWCSTFHSICGRILRSHAALINLRTDFTIINTDDQNRLIKSILKDLDIDTKQFPIKNYIYKIQRLKDNAVTVDNLSKSDADDYQLPNFGQVYQRYQKNLQNLNAVDFGDMILHNLTIFNQYPDIAQIYRDKFVYIFVDEYQDTNSCQYQWLMKIVNNSQNICCVGDDDQSIYSWRGAQVANILRFSKDFANAKIVKLEENYRSTPNILKLANNIIKNNSSRHQKTLFSSLPKGQNPQINVYLDNRSEAENIADQITNIVADNNLKLKDIAILVRAGYQTRSFEEAFLAKSINYKVIGGTRFYDRKEIRDIIAYLRLIYNLDDSLALVRIANVPKRGIGNTSLENLHVMSQNNDSSMINCINQAITEGKLKGKAKESLSNLIEKIKFWNQNYTQMMLSDLTTQVLENCGYNAMLKSDNTPEGADRSQNIKEFIDGIDKFNNLGEFLEYVSLISDSDAIKEDFDAVNIMTIHGAKGLEFDTIFIPGLEEGVFPSSKSLDDQDNLEEERRLAYVAITRAKQRLYLSYAQSRFLYGEFQSNLPSRFLKEIGGDDQQINLPSSQKRNFSPSDNTSQKQVANDDFSRNNRVFHQKFGYGKVTKIDGDKLKINFEKN